MTSLYPNPSPSKLPSGRKKKTKKKLDHLAGGSNALSLSIYLTQGYNAVPSTI